MKTSKVQVSPKLLFANMSQKAIFEESIPSQQEAPADLDLANYFTPEWLEKAWARQHPYEEANMEIEPRDEKAHFEQPWNAWLREFSRAETTYQSALRNPDLRLPLVPARESITDSHLAQYLSLVLSRELVYRPVELSEQQFGKNSSQCYRKKDQADTCLLIRILQEGGHLQDFRQHFGEFCADFYKLHRNRYQCNQYQIMVLMDRLQKLWQSCTSPSESICIFYKNYITISGRTKEQASAFLKQFTQPQKKAVGRYKQSKSRLFYLETSPNQTTDGLRMKSSELQIGEKVRKPTEEQSRVVSARSKILMDREESLPELFKGEPTV